MTKIRLLFRQERALRTMEREVGMSQALIVEEPDCPMCGGRDRSVLYRFDEFGVVRCAACGFSYLSPRLTEKQMLALYRSGQYFEGGRVGYDSYADQERSLRITFRRVVSNLAQRGYGGGDLLEVGCGYGFLLEEARGAFRSVTGTEFSDDAVASARQRGLNVLFGGIEAVASDARFDCIISTHVLEHVYEPHVFLRDLVRLLRPGGAMMIATPDMGSTWRHLMRSRWPSFKVPEHVMYFDRRSLERVMTEVGLEAIRPFPYAHSFPLALVASKLGLPWLPGRAGRIGRIPIWLPATTLAMSGQVPSS